MNNIISVVIIDDDVNLSYNIKENIDKLDEFNVVGIAHDGESAIDLIEKTSPNVVILDIVMPIRDGISVLEYFNNNNKNKNTEFIILSALEHEMIAKNTLKMGVLYYIIKPFNINNLIYRLKQLLLGTNDLIINNEDEFFNKKIMDKLITKELLKLGVPIHIKGFNYIKQALKIYLENKNTDLKITKSIYPILAKQNNTSPYAIEKAIRNAIETTIKKGNPVYINICFKNEIFNKKITNKEFILGIYEVIINN